MSSTSCVLVCDVKYVCALVCVVKYVCALVCVVKYVCVLQGRTPIDVAPESMEPLLLRLQKQQESVSRIVLVLLSAAVSLPLL